MKKILIIMLILLFSCQVCSAEEDVGDNDAENIFTSEAQTSTELQGYLEYEEEPTPIYLEEQPESSQNTVYLKAPTSTKSLTLKAPQKVDSKSLISSSIKKTPITSNKTLESASKFATQEYSINPINSSYSINGSKGMSFGTIYDSSIDGSQATYTTGIFSRYDGKHFAFTTTFAKNTNSDYSSYTDKVYLSPELKLTKRLSLLDVMQTDMLQLNKKNEVVLRYNPNIKNHTDDVQLEVGAGQSFYQDSFVKSSLRFSTRFKL